MFPRHFDGKRFYNPDAPQVPGLLDAFRWKLNTRPQPSPGFIDDVEPVIPPRRWEASGLRTTLVNHSTVLLQQRGSNILTDPIWSERTSPLSWIGPRRRRKPGVSWEDLPPIDAVLISHNHYDHLDLPTLRRLAARGVSTFIVPAGVARLLRSQNIGPVHELDWGSHQGIPPVHVLYPALGLRELPTKPERHVRIQVRGDHDIALVSKIGDTPPLANASGSFQIDEEIAHSRLQELLETLV